MDMAVKIKKLSVTLDGKVQALKDVTIDMPIGKTIGVIGPSGAGKTTLIRSIVGMFKLSNGSVTVLGKPAGSPELRQKVTYMSQDLSVYSDLTVRENLAYFSTMSGQSRSDTKTTIKRILETVDMVDKADSLVSDLSGGQSQRVSLAIALIGSPQLMVLDEPTVGLDPVLRDKLWSLFGRLAKQGITLIISSHSMDEASRCDDLVLIRDGKIIAHNTPVELLKRTETDSVERAFLKLVGESE
ncbi:MAG: ABC transporter ATP-binding protein [Candidatus Saccharibacteria bacterium]